jgi:hypothetical protein
MRLFFQLAAFAILFSLASSADAVELKYIWKAGSVLLYRYEEVTHFKAAGLDSILAVRSTFSERIVTVGRDGTAKLDFTIEKLELKLGSQSLDIFYGLPPKARTLHGQVDARGHYKFDRMATVFLVEGRLYVGSRDARVSGARMHITPIATIDPRTGILANETIHEVQVDEYTPAIDAVPGGLFEMLVLPVGEQRLARGAELRRPIGPLRSTLARTKGAVATLATRSTSKKSSFDADILSRFDIIKGRLLEVRGTLIRRLPMKSNSLVILTNL